MVIVIFIGVGERKMMIFIIGKKSSILNIKKIKILFFRLKEVSLKIIRPPASIARYKMLPHTKRVPSIWNKRYIINSIYSV
jgi:hypothetical protein